MSHSTLTISDDQYLRAFRQLFTPQHLKSAVAARRRPTPHATRVLPLWLLLGLLITWFWLPAEKLPFLLRWLRPGRNKLPSDPAVYLARGRLGWAPLRWLRTHVPGPLATPELDPSAFHHGRRRLGLDGTTFTVADTPANAHTFGRANNQHHASGSPLIRVVAVCELGTHALINWIARRSPTQSGRPPTAGMTATSGLTPRRSRTSDRRGNNVPVRRTTPPQD